MSKDFFVYFLCQVAGEKKIKSGNISSRPASISRESTIFPKGENCEKLFTGPTPARPGPTLLSVAEIAVKEVVRSKPSMRINKSEIVKTKIYVAKYTFTILIVS